MAIRLIASDFYTYFQPSKCENRVYLKHIGKEEAPPGPYQEVLMRLGERHEMSHLATFPQYVDVSEGSLEERQEKTKAALQEGAGVIYQGALASSCEFEGQGCEILGEPDFLIRQEDGYVIRDSKISRRITEKEHPEILRQLEIYGWLYERSIGAPPLALQVHSGSGDIVALNYDGGAEALNLFGQIVGLKTIEAEPYSPVGWSKCGGCSFHDYCWTRAEENNDVALVQDVDQNLAATLKQQGISTVDDLLQNFDASSLSELRRPWGKRMQRVGKKASSIIRNAKAMAEGKEIVIEATSIPEHSNYVMFDLEGLPPHLDELEKIYLWGMQIFGKEPSDFMPAAAGFGEEGDRAGWESFLDNAEAILTRYGDIPFVHWHHYERDKIKLYWERYGDRNGIAERVKGNLLDLLPVTKRSIALPLPSYSLKVVEKYVGFRRALDEAAGDWAMAKYIEASETEDPEQRDAVMSQILDYNREDLEATWAVLNWLKAKGY